MHETAKYIVNWSDGIFPGSYDELIKLKGIGPYTAAAIASIAFNEPVSAVDGNISRVLARLFLIEGNLKTGPGKAQIKELADYILDKKNPGQHNQAVMELGAIICLPGKPRCLECPLSSQCLAFKDNRILEIPVKYQRKKLRKRYFNYFIIVTDHEKILIQKREGNDIWKGLYEPPLIETPVRLSQAELLKYFDRNFNIKDLNYTITKISPGIKHILSHQYIIARFVHVKINGNGIRTLSGDKWIGLNDLNDYPVPRLIERYFSEQSI